jgi:hypothetical protein
MHTADVSTSAHCAADTALLIAFIFNFDVMQ